MAVESVLHLFIIISIGYFLGNLKFRNFSLDISAILIVALIAGHYGVRLPEEFKNFGLAIFIYAVGLQTGPVFFETIKSKGLILNLTAGAIILTIFGIILAAGKYFHYPSYVISGIFSGAMSSATALAASLEFKYSPATSVFFGVIYPFGIIASVLFVRFIPSIINVDIQKEADRYSEDILKVYPKIISKNFRITNDNFKKNVISKSQFQDMTSAVIERIETSYAEKSDLKDPVLHYGDIVRVTCSEEELNRVMIILGEEITRYVDFHDNMKVLRLLLTSKGVVGKKIGELKRLNSMMASITKVRRSGIDITPNPSLTLMLGDKLYITAPSSKEKEVTEYIGDNLMNYPAGDFLPISLGIVIGMTAGMIPIYLPFFGSFRLSFVGGIFITALILGRMGRVGKIVWQLSPHSTSLLKTIGQLMFMAAIGANSGKFIYDSIAAHGLTSIYISLLAILFALVVFGFIMHKIMKMNMIDIMGLLAGAMTSTPTLTMANGLSKSEYSSVSYAAVYPFSLILTMLLAELVLKL